MKRIIAIFTITLMCSMVILSCSKEEVDAFSTTKILSKYQYDSDSILMVNGERMEWFFNAPKHKLSKGLLMEEIGEDWEYGYAYLYGDTTHKFKTMKVHKQKEPGKFFYVMLTNLDINSSSSWAYNDDLSLVPKYGRLYTWNKADELKSNVYMDLPIYRKDGTIFSNHHKTAARLMTIEDVCDIIEMDNVARLPQYGYQLNSEHENFDSYYYYDVFVFGPEYSNNRADAEHSLAGIRTVEWEHSDRYQLINKFGSFWLSDKYVENDTLFHFPLSVDRRSNSKGGLYDYAAYINCVVRNESGNSVRYVFEPVYRTR